MNLTLAQTFWQVTRHTYFLSNFGVQILGECFVEQFPLDHWG